MSDDLDATSLADLAYTAALIQARNRYTDVASQRAREDNCLMILVVGPDGFYMEQSYSLELAADGGEQIFGHVVLGGYQAERERILRERGQRHV